MKVIIRMLPGAKCLTGTPLSYYKLHLIVNEIAATAAPPSRWSVATERRVAAVYTGFCCWAGTMTGFVYIPLFRCAFNLCRVFEFKGPMCCLRREQHMQTELRKII